MVGEHKETAFGIPTIYEADIARAIAILKEDGCTEIYLFGSLAEGKASDSADIDLAVKGCPADRFFHLLGRLILVLDHPVDLVNLDKNDEFAEFLESEGRLRRVA